MAAAELCTSMRSLQYVVFAILRPSVRLVSRRGGAEQADVYWALARSLARSFAHDDLEIALEEEEEARTQ